MTARVPTLILACLTLAATACAETLVRPAPFRARPDSVERGDLAGPYDGRVVDGDTDRPVAGALVYASWTFDTGFGMSAPAGYKDFVGTTDATGHYVVPRLEDTPDAPARLSEFHIVIYKRGFVAYRSDSRFEDFGPRTDFTQRGYEVSLAHWRPEMSHVRHLRYVGGGAALSALTSWEIPEAAAELSGHKMLAAATATPAGPGPSTAPAEANLNAGKLFSAGDVIAVTGFSGTFDISALGDDPTSPHYDSVHLQARGKEETYDVALRVWHFDRDEAQKRYERLMEEIPGAKAKNELADKSLRGATPAGDVLAVAFLDLRRGVVVFITCGAAQCKSHETLLQVARRVKERVDAQIPLLGGTP